ncbi:hypothetical protein CLOM_g16276 [Closterium sp. NIES-68]|nr:hypothetical protein CLOM_g16276 [Closterium sp. NIES-68]
MEIDLQQPPAEDGTADSADVVRLVTAEHQRILSAFRKALDSPLPPSQLALPTLADALQLGGSGGGGGGTGSAATGTPAQKDGKLTVEQNQLLEIGLRSLLQSLVESAAAQGVSVLAYGRTEPPVASAHAPMLDPEGPGGSAAGVDGRDGDGDASNDASTEAKGPQGSTAASAVIRLLDVVLQLCSQGRMEGGVVFQLLEDLMEQSPISDCQLVFSYIESKQQILGKEHILQRGKLVLLRACNQLVRRLSKANDLVFCGRVLMFLAYFFPIAEKSAVNIKGAFNTSNKTDYAREPPQDGAALLDFNFYTTFWSLQEYFSNPPLAAAKWPLFSSHLRTVLETFQAQPLGADAETAAGTGAGEEAEAAAGAGAEVGAGAGGSAAGGGVKGSAAPLGAGGAGKGEGGESGGGGGVGGVGEMLGAYNMKYLTSASLLGLELRDCSFRRQFLVQCLILLDYLMIPGKVEKDEKREAMRVEAREFEARVKKLLRRLPPAGEDFLSSVEHVMRRERQWVAWKKEVCPPFDRPPADLTPRRDPAPKRPRYVMGNKELDRLFRWADKHPDALTDPEQVAVPAFRDFVQPLAEDMDPENGIEAEYHKTNDKVFCWRALRLAARSDIEAFNRFGDLGMEGVVPPDMLPEEIRVKLHKTKPRKDSHADRDAGKEVAKGAANKEAVADAAKDAAAGTALPPTPSATTPATPPQFPPAAASAAAPSAASSPPADAPATPVAPATAAGAPLSAPGSSRDSAGRKSSPAVAAGGGDVKREGRGDEAGDGTPNAKGFVFDLNMDAPDGSPAAAAAGARTTPGSAGGGGSGRKGRGGEGSAMEVEGEKKADVEGEGRASASKKRSRVDE